MPISRKLKNKLKTNDFFIQPMQTLEEDIESVNYSQPASSTEHHVTSGLNIVQLLTSIGFLVFSSMIFIQTEESCSLKFEYSLIIVCILCLTDIHRTIESYWDHTEESARKCLVKISGCISSFGLFVMFFYLLFYYLTESCYNLNRIYFFDLTFLAVNYVLVFIVQSILYCLILGGFRYLTPQTVIQTLEGYPLRIGANQEQLDSLEKYEYKDCTLTDSIGNIIAISYEDSSCSICLQDYTNGDILTYLICKHHLHKTCGDSWFNINKSCPVCRQGF